MTFLDAGQGDSAVVQLPDKKVIIMDTGRSGRETAAFLACEGIRNIDAFLISHIHSDHSGGAAYLSKEFAAKEIWDNGRIIYPEEMETKAVRRTLQRGDVIEAKDYTITALHPYSEFHTRDGNDYDE